jgi:hypothetical protein
MDTISLSALIISILSSLGHFVKDSHIQKCKMCLCIESDCIQRKQSLTPTTSQPKFENIDNNTDLTL